MFTNAPGICLAGVWKGMPGYSCMELMTGKTQLGRTDRGRKTSPGRSRHNKAGRIGDDQRQRDAVRRGYRDVNLNQKDSVGAMSARKVSRHE